MIGIGLDAPNPDLDNLIEAYFADQRILAANSAALLAEHKPVPKTPLAGYDGRLFDWLIEMLNHGPADGPERAWPIVVQLVARAPHDEALASIGASAIEDLVNKHGVQFEDRIIEQATTDSRFRRALRHVWFHDAAPNTLKELIEASRSVDAG